MEKLRRYATRNSLIAYIYFAGMMVAATIPLITLYILLYAVGCR